MSHRMVKAMVLNRLIDPKSKFHLFRNIEDLYLLVLSGWKGIPVGKEYRKADEYFNKAYGMAIGNEGYYPNMVTEYLYNIISNKNLADGIEIIDKESLKLKNHTDFHFVSGLFYMELIFSDVEKYKSLLYKIERCFLTCLELGETNYFDSVQGTGSFLAAYNLGVYYEVTGSLKQALNYFQYSAELNYVKAIQRLFHLTNK